MITLAQAKLNTQDDIQAGVIDEFRKSSFILDNIPFDDAVTPGTNGATLTYGYTRLITQPTAASGQSTANMPAGVESRGIRLS